MIRSNEIKNNTDDNFNEYLYLLSIDKLTFKHRICLIYNSFTFNGVLHLVVSLNLKHSVVVSEEVNTTILNSIKNASKIVPVRESNITGKYALIPKTTFKLAKDDSLIIYVVNRRPSYWTICGK